MKHRFCQWSAIPLGFQPPAGLVAVGSFPSQRLAGECGLAILATGFEYWTLPAGPCFILCVRPDAVAAALAEVRAWADAPAPRRAAGVRSGFDEVEKSAGLLFPFAVLWIGLWLVQLELGGAWREAGRVDAALVVDGGQWWRCLTALTLHADVVHWLANGLAGGGFAFLVGRYFGSGWNWLLILLAGFLGNLANAWVQYPEHLSIGGSTAVFGALGLLTGGTLHAALKEGGPGSVVPRWWTPLLGGLVLLGLLGAGGAPEIDVGAHVLGFVAGLLLGLSVAPFRWALARRRPLGVLAAAVALGGIAAAWFAAATA